MASLMRPLSFPDRPLKHPYKCCAKGQKTSVGSVTWTTRPSETLTNEEKYLTTWISRLSPGSIFQSDNLFQTLRISSLTRASACSIIVFPSTLASIPVLPNLTLPVNGIPFLRQCSSIPRHDISWSLRLPYRIRGLRLTLSPSLSRIWDNPRKNMARLPHGVLLSRMKDTRNFLRGPPCLFRLCPFPYLFPCPCPFRGLDLRGLSRLLLAYPSPPNRVL